jgi:molecular chaperone GrpE
MKDKHEKEKNIDVENSDEIQVENLNSSETEHEDDVVFEEESAGGSSVKIKKLREELKLCQKEKQEYLDGWQRAKADFVNARNEEERRRADTIKFANKELVLEILTVADSFDMAFANKESWEKVDKNWRVGVEYIYNQLLNVLEQNDLKQLVPLGQTFDPNVHTSVESIPVEKKEDDHKILEVVQKGYTMHGSLVRSPKVKVGVFKE